MQIVLHLVCVVQIVLISVWGIKLDLIPVKDEMDLFVVRVVEND